MQCGVKLIFNKYFVNTIFNSIRKYFIEAFMILEILLEKSQDCNDVYLTFSRENYTFVSYNGETNYIYRRTSYISSTVARGSFVCSIIVSGTFPFSRSYCPCINATASSFKSQLVTILTVHSDPIVPSCRNIPQAILPRLKQP